MKYRCPVCMFTQLPYPPCDYHICPCCGTEFGNEDVDFTYQQLREMWIAGGANWFFGRPPEHWNPWLQLIKAGDYFAFFPKFVSESRFQANTEATSTITIHPGIGAAYELLVSSSI